MTDFDLKSLVVRCSACGRQLNQRSLIQIKKHRKLDVITCKECYEFYGSSEFSQDEAGYNYCTWCGNGGRLTVCDFCPNGFCSACIRRNFGRSEIAITAKKGWKCYCCNKRCLKSKVEFCNLILQKASYHSQKTLVKRDKKKAFVSPNDNDGISENWLQKTFNDCDASVRLFTKRISELRLTGVSKKKSLKHIIKKLEDVVIKHREALKDIVKAVFKDHENYLKKQRLAKKEEKHNVEKFDTVNSDCDIIGNIKDKPTMENRKLLESVNEEEGDKIETMRSSKSDFNKIATSTKNKSTPKNIKCKGDSDLSSSVETIHSFSSDGGESDSNLNFSKDKLQLEPRVVLFKCDHLLKDDKKTLIFSDSSDIEDKLDNLEDSLCKFPRNKKSNRLLKGKQSLDPLKMRAMFNGDMSVDNVLEISEEDIKEKKFICDQCKKEFSSNIGLHRHSQIHKKKYAHVVCRKKFSQKIHSNMHASLCNSVKSFACPYCDKSFLYRSALKQHTQEVHSKQQPFVCLTCKRAFSRKYNLKIHSLIHKRLFVCEFCKKGFSQKCQLVSHQHSDHKQSLQRNFSCRLCKKKKSSKRSLEIHLRIHTRTKPYNCDICSKGFLKIYNLKKHLAVHTTKQPFHCGSCDRKFSFIYALNQHQLHHKKQKPLIVKRKNKSSGVCNLRKEKETSKADANDFSDDSNNTEVHNVKVHAHNVKNKKSLLCNVCERKFHHIAALKRHIVDHYDETNSVGIVDTFSSNGIDFNIDDEPSSNSVDANINDKQSSKGIDFDINDKPSSNSVDSNIKDKPSSNSVDFYTNDESSSNGVYFYINDKPSTNSVDFYTNNKSSSNSVYFDINDKPSSNSVDFNINDKPSSNSVDFYTNDKSPSNGVDININDKQPSNSIDININDKQFSKNIHAHNQKNKKLLSCNVCQKKFIGITFLKNHIVDHYDED